MEWLGISQSVWEILFSIIRYIIGALILAYFVRVYVNRRKVSLDVNADTLKHRLEGYRDINKQIAKIQNIIASPMSIQAQYADAIDGLEFNLEDQGYEYSSLFHSKDSLRTFFEEFEALIRKHRLYIDEVVEDKMMEFQKWYSDVLKLYDGFCKAEADSRWKSRKEVAEFNMAFAAQTLGIIFQHDINKFHRQLKKLLTGRIKKIRLGNIPGANTFRLRSMIAHHCEKRMDGDTMLSSSFRWIYYRVLYPTYGQSQLIQYSGRVCLALIYIHYGEKLSSEYRYDMSPEEFLSLAEPFRQCLAEYLKQ